MIDTRLESAQISKLLPHIHGWGPIEVVETTGSTNVDLAAAARAGARAGRVLLAKEQTAGHGRLGRQWVSPKGASISMSVLVEPKQPAARWGWLSLLPGMAVRDALVAVAPQDVKVTLKWPNDVLIDGLKVCGILSERIDRPSGALAIVGLGINMTLGQEQLPVPNATSLLLKNFSTSSAEVVARVLTALEHYYRRWEEKGTLRAEYSKLCSSIGMDLTVTTATEKIQGIGCGVDDDGCIEVRVEEEIRSFAVGDVVHARLA